VATLQQHVGLQRVALATELASFVYVAAKLAALTPGSGRATVINDGNSLA